MDKYIKMAKMVLAREDIASPIIVKHINAPDFTSAKIAITALGFFTLYINNKRVGEDYFTPVLSIAHARDTSGFLYPSDEEYTYRLYYHTYDITNLLSEGDNLLEVHLGDGFYRQWERRAEGDTSFGSRLGTQFAISIDDGELVLCSDGNEKCRQSFVTYSQLFVGEHQDMRLLDKDFPLYPTEILSLPHTLLAESNAPTDKLALKIAPKSIYKDDERQIFDTGANISGFVRIRLTGAEGDKVTLRFAENIDIIDGKCNLNFTSIGDVYVCTSGIPQIMQDEFISDGKDRETAPCFVWHGFRYFEVVGECEIVRVEAVYSSVDVTASFDSSSQELNWLIDASWRTILDNMHLSFPSDCPHRERLGYTGDGQVVAPLAMLTMDSREFYRKWIEDIFDSQDIRSGHIGHTAPVGGGGGGPGGWGMAAITVPCSYYKYFGDSSPLLSHLDGIEGWISYLMRRVEASPLGLLDSEEEGGWCLGDWAALDEMEIPMPYVNTCLLIRALHMLAHCLEFALPSYELSDIFAIINRLSSRVIEIYYNHELRSFCGGVQGADAFALAANLGGEELASSLAERYKRVGVIDCGFLGADLLIEQLVRWGYADIAFSLLTSHCIGSFGYLMDKGATTLWEYMNGNGSHCHPMFSACSRQIFEGFLGISQREDSFGFARLIIKPRLPEGVARMSASLLLPIGELSIAISRTDRGEELELSIPENDTVLQYNNEEVLLTKGTHRYIIIL
ncbi:MAG: family 78 glycoside hydrolase catalytic domain [Clostridia bacterium]|nr:family 78 glycoside hydrolase catalytic domain [Clostridia bacterium]